jgi:hypothetical protein
LYIVNAVELDAILMKQSICVGATVEDQLQRNGRTQDAAQASGLKCIGS